MSTVIAVTPGWVLPKKTATTTLFDIQTVGILKAKGKSPYFMTVTGPH